MFGHRRPQAGETLVELLVSITLLGVAGAAVMGTLLMGTRASSVTTGSSVNQNVLRNWAEQVEAMPYVLCAYPTKIPAPYQNIPVPPTGTSLAITQIRYWDGSAYQLSGPSCLDVNDKGLQEVTLQATSNTIVTGDPQTQLVIVKRRGCASGC